MKTYYGTTVIQARRMTYGTFLAATSVPNNGIHSVLDRGYFIEPKGWLPQDQFEAQYQQTDSLDFSHALTAMKQGHRVTRPELQQTMEMVVYYDEETNTLKYDAPVCGPPGFLMGLIEDGLLANDWRIVE